MMIIDVISIPIGTYQLLRNRPSTRSFMMCAGNRALFSSRRWRSSRHVFGSGTTAAIGTPNSRRAATGCGPLAITAAPLRAATNSSREQMSSAACARARVPTPVKNMTRSSRPSLSADTNFKVSPLSSAGTSRVIGTTSGWPPLFAMSRPISRARRLSSANTRSPRRAYLPVCMPRLLLASGGASEQRTPLPTKPKGSV